MIGIITLVVSTTSVFYWREHEINKQGATAAVWMQRAYQGERGAVTPEEAYRAILGAAAEEDMETAQRLIIGSVSHDMMTALPPIERVRFLPDVVAGIARAVTNKEYPATDIRIDDRAFTVPAGIVERVFVFHQLSNRRWVLALP